MWVFFNKKIHYYFFFRKSDQPFFIFLFYSHSTIRIALLGICEQKIVHKLGVVHGSFEIYCVFTSLRENACLKLFCALYYNV